MRDLSVDFFKNNQILVALIFIHFELILVHGDRHGSSFSFLQADNHFSQPRLLKRLSFLYHVFLAFISLILGLIIISLLLLVLGFLVLIYLTWNISLHALFALKVSVEKSTVI
jgi:hypothetical protein